MPPKPRGRGSTRARGGGRGGATAGRSSAGEATDTATPQGTNPSEAPEAFQPSMIPKQESSNDVNPSIAGDQVSTTIESQAPSSIAASTVSTPQDGAETSSRPPVQRLGDLKSLEPPSRSSSPSVRRGSSVRGKKVMVKPTFTGRRSKEERTALEREALEREKERTKERDQELQRREKKAARDAEREAKRATRGRGGYSGAMSGPFSLGSSREDRKVNNRNFSGFGSGSGSRAERVKNEDGGHGGGSGSRSSGGGGGGGGPSIKREDGGYVSSEDEEDTEFPRRDIDLIEISSDENDAPAERPGRSTLPVRIGRKEHQERAFGINTDASTETSAKILEDVEETDGKSSTANTTGRTSGKGKGKAKDVEITGSRKPFKGVWQDPDDTVVKSEPVSDDENMADSEQIGIVEIAEKPGSSPDAERKPRTRLQSISEPVLQTDEDRAEWARFQSNLRHIRAELGPNETPMVDGADDVNMTDAAAEAKKASVRDNNVYLFQIPPLMPELLLPDQKKELSDSPAPPVKTEPIKIKMEEGFSDPSAKALEGPRFASGLVGKLRVRQSGRTTLDWGGTSYELTPGNKASFLQEVVSINVIPEKDRVVEEDAGEAVSFGRVKGKFVVVPDWKQMLG